MDTEKREARYRRTGIVKGNPITIKKSPKIGRNEKCYCGSGKKFKHCHLK